MLARLDKLQGELLVRKYSLQLPMQIHREQNREHLPLVQIGLVVIVVGVRSGCEIEKKMNLQIRAMMIKVGD